MAAKKEDAMREPSYTGLVGAQLAKTHGSKRNQHAFEVIMTRASFSIIVMTKKKMYNNTLRRILGNFPPCTNHVRFVLLAVTKRKDTGIWLGIRILLGQRNEQETRNLRRCNHRQKCFANCAHRSPLPARHTTTGHPWPCPAARSPRRRGRGRTRPRRSPKRCPAW